VSQFNDSGYKAFTAGGALGVGILVKFSSGKLAAAALTDEWIGVTTQQAFADGDIVTVALRSKQGTYKMAALTSFAQGAIVYGRAGGKVDDVATSSAVRVGMALEAAGAVNDLVEIMVC
jgi:hypothetical protein